MKYKTKINRILTIVMAILFIGMTFSASTSQLTDNKKIKINSKKIVQTFSQPEIIEEEKYSKIFVKEASSYPMQPLNPMLPAFIKTYEFPLGTKITDLRFTTSEIKTKSIQKNIKPYPMPKTSTSQKIINKETYNKEIYDSTDPYPSSFIDIRKGAGLNTENKHVLFFSMKIYPVRYIPSDNKIEYINSIEITIEYEEPNKELTYQDPVYDLAIITPRKFVSKLNRLVIHKNSYDIETKIFTLEGDIYGQYQGRDDAEQIKYFIKHAIEEWGISYVLLVGDIQKIPIRTTYPSFYYYYGMEDVLSDLYYADIYDYANNFCSWDSNGNNKFGELYYDEVDLHPDVHLGRLPCSYRFEAAVMVNKIINYEKKTYGKDWFNNLLLIGGDTHPDGYSWGNEGEITNDIVAGFMPEFNPIRLWASLGNLNVNEINKEINKGVGFIDYSGHGFETGLGTHPPMDESWLFYHTHNIYGLLNKNKLPIVFFDACLTAKLDFDIAGLTETLSPELQEFLNKIPINHSKLFPTFAWYFVKKIMGGAIASIGATRVAYGYVDEYFWFGSGGLLIYFYRAYDEGIHLGQMLTIAQNDYIAGIYPDPFTLEEFILIGDPTLKVGGYP